MGKFEDYVWSENVWRCAKAKKVLLKREEAKVILLLNFIFQTCLAQMFDFMRQFQVVSI